MIKIRRFKPQDLDRVYEIELKSFKDPYNILFLLNLHQAYNESFFVVENERMVVAYSISRVVNGRGHVLAIAVDPAYRRRGIGSLLVNRIMEHFRSLSIEEMWLEVRVSNLSARNFYKKIAFEEKGLCRAYYSDREDAVILTKNLVESY